VVTRRKGNGLHLLGVLLTFAVSLYACLCFCILLTNEVTLEHVIRVNKERTLNCISEIKNGKIINVSITEEVELNVNYATYQQDISGR